MIFNTLREIRLSSKFSEAVTQTAMGRTLKMTQY